MPPNTGACPSVRVCKGAELACCVHMSQLMYLLSNVLCVTWHIHGMRAYFTSPPHIATA